MGRDNIEKEIELNEKHGIGRINVLRKVMRAYNLQREEVYVLTDLLRIEREIDNDLLRRESGFLAEGFNLEEYDLLEFMSSNETDDEHSYEFDDEAVKPLVSKGYLQIVEEGVYELTDKARLLFPDNYEQD